MLLGAVADDFTGATDLATTLRDRGLRTSVVIDDAIVDPARLDGLDAVVVALKTRTAPRDAAVAASEAALDRLLGWGAERIYLKYCSTFDSTDEGNIGPVLDAFAARLGVDRAVVVPAFPANGRTVRDGVLRVGDALLSESSMRHHPLTPMTRSRISELLEPQTRAPITEIPLAVVRRGPDALREALDGADPGWLVVDAVDDDDLDTIARATSHHRLVSGAAGLATGFEAREGDAEDGFPRWSGRRLVVCGSASEATRGQVAHAVASGLPTRRVDVTRAMADPAEEAAALGRWVRDLGPHEVPVVYSVGVPADVVPRDGAGGAADAVERVLSVLVADLVGDGTVDRVVVAGGETSGAVVRALGIDLLTVGPRLAPGVCWTASVTGSGQDVALVLKSGGFGAADLFTSAWEVLS